MKIITPLLSMFLLLLAGCTDTRDNSDLPGNNGSAADLIGTWQLINASGGIAGTNDNFPEGTITWTFNITTQQLTVVNSNNDPLLNDALDSGIYDYEIVNSQAPETCAKTLLIDGMDYGCFIFTETGLIVSQSYADGLNYNFIR